MLGQHSVSRRVLNFKKMLCFMHTETDEEKKKRTTNNVIRILVHLHVAQNPIERERLIAIYVEFNERKLSTTERVKRTTVFCQI